ncbi:hypothetical protein A6302_02379 [Methylobrevis pamukkalensis]|uniref:Uncharacterized protein n=1 Tax=Methylobrevis pamukkalensis TaxID=1439726 RepID=A0A1E3H1U6_9HYPH|nr:hypothetical protein A6302_02379 [Methylobrevis pamukkalensis]
MTNVTGRCYTPHAKDRVCAPGGKRAHHRLVAQEPEDFPTGLVTFVCSR